MTPTLESFLALLLQKNEQMNLTATTDPVEAAVRHIEDSLTLLPFLPEGATVIDVGSGGGLPGLPLRIQNHALRMTLLDATEKKVDFLRDICGKLQLSDVYCLCARAEEAALLPANRDRFDAAVSRGVAFLPVLCELCLPFVRPGGVFLAMKGTDCEAEIAAAAHALRVLGGRLKSLERVTLSGGLVHTVVVIEKVSPTPAGYPRRFAKIKAAPL